MVPDAAFDGTVTDPVKAPLASDVVLPAGLPSSARSTALFGGQPVPLMVIVWPGSGVVSLAATDVVPYSWARAAPAESRTAAMIMNTIAVRRIIRVSLIARPGLDPVKTERTLPNSGVVEDRSLLRLCGIAVPGQTLHPCDSPTARGHHPHAEALRPHVGTGHDGEAIGRIRRQKPGEVQLEHLGRPRWDRERRGVRVAAVFGVSTDRTAVPSNVALSSARDDDTESTTGFEPSGTPTPLPIT